MTNSVALARVCAVASSLGFLVAAKRVAVGIYLGRQTFSNYSDLLAQVMQKMLQVSQVAILAKAIERKWEEGDRYLSTRSDRRSHDNLLGLIESANDEFDGVPIMDRSFASRRSNDDGDMGRVIDTEDVDPFTGDLGEAQKARIADLLGSWEEPARGARKKVRSRPE